MKILNVWALNTPVILQEFQEFLLDISEITYQEEDIFFGSSVESWVSVFCKLLVLQRTLIKAGQANSYSGSFSWIDVVYSLAVAWTAALQSILKYTTRVDFLTLQLLVLYKLTAKDLDKFCLWIEKNS